MQNKHRSASGIVASSALARTAHAMLSALGAATVRSSVCERARNITGVIARMPPDVRVRLGGVVILVAIVTHAVLLQWVPSVVRPYAPGLRLHVSAAALVLVMLAGPIARAWPASRVAHWLSRLLSNTMHG